MKEVKKIPLLLLCAMTTAIGWPSAAQAQQQLNLDDCRSMAIQSNNDLTTAGVQMKMAEYEKKSIRANWFPDISAT